MRKFHPATVVAKHAETDDSVCLTLDVPEDARPDFAYHQGQHLPIRAKVGDKNLRRTYSLCSSVADGRLRIGVRIQPDGQCSNFLADEVHVGDTLDVMPPSGHFYTELDPQQAKRYAAFVAGSGITPILSIAKTTLETEPGSRFTIFYGNRRRKTTMFMDELWALKNCYPERLALHFVMSQEPGDIELYQGRIDGERTTALHKAFLAQARPDDVFVCGPNPMIDEVTAALVALDYPAERIHSERFRAILKDGEPRRPKKTKTPKGGVEVSVILDGHRQQFHMDGGETSILDAGNEAGLDLPYSCKGGVCSTCRAHLRKGEVDMDVNYALEPWELEQGYILTCQARPKSRDIELDYDKA